MYRVNPATLELQVVQDVIVVTLNRTKTIVQLHHNYSNTYHNTKIGLRKNVKVQFAIATGLTRPKNTVGVHWKYLLNHLRL